MGFEIANHTRHHEHIDKLHRDKALEVLHYIDNKCDSMGIPKPEDFAYLGYGLNESALELRITSYNVCYTKLLRGYLSRKINSLAAIIGVVAGA